MMHWLNRQSAVAIVASLMLVVGLGCSEDDVDNQDPNQVEDDAGIDDAGDDDTDVEPDDAGDADTGQDADDGEDDNYDEEDFDVEPVECAYPPGPEEEDCPDGDFGPATFFAQFEIADDSDNPCCFDLDEGTDDPENFDNFIGEEILPAVEASLTGFEDVNDNIESSIEAGYLMYLLEAYRWDHPGWDDALMLNVYRGGEVDSTGAAMNGNGEFLLDPENFDADGSPHHGFEDVWVVEDGRLEASAGSVEITLPSIVEGLGVKLADVRLQGDVVQDPQPDLTAGGEFAIENGEMGGVLMRDEFYKTLNEASHECDCFDFEFDDPDNPDPWEEGVFRFHKDEDADDDDPGTWVCEVGKSIGAGVCEDDSDPPRCQTLGDEQLCSILEPFASPQVTDQEVDGEVGYSIGTRFESVPAEIIGIVGEDD